MNEYNIRKYRFDNDTKKEMLAYLNDGTEPGEFCKAILCNQLVETFMKADQWTRKAIPEIVDWFLYEVPIRFWGSIEKFEKHKETLMIKPMRQTIKQLAEQIVDAASDPKIMGNPLSAKIRGCALRIVEIEKGKKK